MSEAVAEGFIIAMAVVGPLILFVAYGREPHQPWYDLSGRKSFDNMDARQRFHFALACGVLTFGALMTILT